MHTHMKKYVNIKLKYFRNHILIQNSPKHPNLQTLEKKNSKKSTIIEQQTFFFFLHIQGLNPMMTPPLKMDYDKSRR